MAKLLALLLVQLVLTIAQATDNDSDTDFAIPGVMTGSNIDESFFTYTGLRGNPFDSTKGSGMAKKMVSMKKFPALGGMGVSMELLEFPPGAVNVPHTHPRGGEILYVLDGALTVGTVDSTGKLYKNDLQKGDMFVFPMGLVHYQANFDKINKATAVSAYGSSNAGTVDLPRTIFGPNVPDDVLAQAFKVSTETIHQIKMSQA